MMVFIVILCGVSFSSVIPCFICCSLYFFMFFFFLFFLFILLVYFFCYIVRLFTLLSCYDIWLYGVAHAVLDMNMKVVKSAVVYTKRFYMYLW